MEERESRATAPILPLPRSPIGSLPRALASADRIAWIRRGRLQRLIALLSLLAVVVVFSVLTCTPAAAVVPASGGQLVEAVVGTPYSLNPLLAEYNEPDRDLAALLFSGLTRPGAQGEPRPDLAQRWEVSPDGRVYVFQLRDRARWHDGEPVTARDVVFTAKLIQHPSYPGSPLLAEALRGVVVEQVDDLTVRFTLRAPFGPFLGYASFGILPAHLLQGTPVRELSASPFPSHPVGSGPFRFKEAALDYVLLEAYPDYHLGRPYLTQIKLRFFPDYPSALAALKRNEVQALGGVDPVDLGELRQSQSWQVLSAPRTNVNLIFLNAQSPLFQNRAVRQALWYGLNRARLIEVAASGQGTLADGPLPVGSWAHSPGGQRDDYDPQRARSLLDGAGWTLGSDGVRARAQGAGQPQRLRFPLITNDDPGRVRLAQEVARQWAALGVQADVSASGATGLVKDFLLPHRFEAVLFGLDLGADPDPYLAWHSTQSRTGGMNFGSYASSDADRLLEQDRGSMDLEQRRSALNRFTALFLDEAPGLPLYQPTYTYVVDRSIKGIQLGPIDRPAARYDDVQSWYVRTRRAFMP